MRIAIDLTPLLPGGSNGGAKIMTVQLIKKLAALAPDDEFLLLTSKKNFDELSALEAPNVRIIFPQTSPGTLGSIFLFFIQSIIWCILKTTRLLSISSNFFTTRLRHFSAGLHGRLLAKNLASKTKADLLFCPFTAPFYRNLNIPIVSVIYDLQSHYYPYFFTLDECFERKKNFEEACNWSNKLICISDFVKQTVLENCERNPEDVKTIHIRLAHRLPHLEKNKIASTLKTYQLTENNFLLYPANFWAHKNHHMLLTAFSMYRTNHPESTLKLVCTGADNEYKHFLLGAIKDMGLAQWVIIPGYLSDDEFSSLVTGSRAIVFPSLYEGFGMPVLEAMANGKPVICSNLTSLPEVAGTAALFFDPKKPQEIEKAIHRIETEPELTRQLVNLGYERVTHFGTEEDMAKEYLQVFSELLQTKHCIA